MGKFKIFQALENSSSLQSGVAKTKQILRNAFMRVGGCSKGLNEPHVSEAESKTFFVDRRNKKLELKGVRRETWK